MTPLKRHPPNKRQTCVTYPEPGAAGQTGNWRIYRPIVDREKCTGCQLCWIYCPDAAITMDEENKPIINLDYCKGCMICEEDCPTKAIARVRETEIDEEKESKS